MKRVLKVSVFSMCAELKVGQYVISRVEEVKNAGRVVRLSTGPFSVAQACAGTQQGWNLTNLLPGLMIKATVKKVMMAFCQFTAHSVCSGRVVPIFLNKLFISGL